MKKYPALTLLELLVVMAIVAVVAVPSFLAIGRVRVQQALASSVEELAGVMKRAHIFSRESKDDRAWGVVYKDSATYMLVSGRPEDPAAEAEYGLAAPVGFSDEAFAVGFDQGTGDTGSEVLITMGGGGQEARVVVSQTGLVEVR